MNLKNVKLNPRLALLGASGMIAAAAFAGTTVAGRAAVTPPPAQAAPAAAEAPETPGVEAAPGTPEANEPALAGGGYADTAASADHQFDGIE